MQRLLLGTIAATAFLASTAVSQNLVPLPPHNNTYTFDSRGYHFTAQTDFFIQQMELPLDSYLTGNTSSFRVDVNGVNGVFYASGGTNALQVCSPPVQINIGDVVVISGNWSDVPVATQTANTSYTPSFTSAAPYNVNIEGVPHDFRRATVSGDVGNPASLSNNFSLATSGQLGRVWIYTTPPAGLFAGFTSDVQIGPSPLTVNFSDNTFTSDPGGVTSWAWDFENDGTVDSTAQNPTFTYTACGTYDVSLTVTDATHAPSTKVETAYITTDATTADFSEGLVGPLTVLFTDTSTGSPTSWDWDLDGDGTTDSTAQNPAWVYANANAVNVTLTVQRLCAAASTITRTIVPLQQISTGFARNNGNGNYGSVMLDLDVLNPTGMTINSLDVHASTVVQTCNLDMYVRQGTYNNFWSNPEEWVLVGTATGTSSGVSNTPFNVIFNSPVYLPPGISGVKFHHRDFYCSYTTGTGTVTFSNADVAMTVGHSQYTSATSAFTGSTLSPRWFAGTIYYETLNISGNAQTGNYGPGCAGALGVPGLTASATPAIGTAVTLTIDNMAAPEIGILLMGLNHTNSTFGALPFDGAIFGAPTCFLRASPDVNQLLVGSAGVATANFAIVNDPSLSGLKVFAQAAVLDAAANAGGAVLSNANAMLIGN